LFDGVGRERTSSVFDGLSHRARTEATELIQGSREPSPPFRLHYCQVNNVHRRRRLGKAASEEGHANYPGELLGGAADYCVCAECVSEKVNCLTGRVRPDAMEDSRLRIVEKRTPRVRPLGGHHAPTHLSQCSTMSTILSAESEQNTIR
jgi:hypothetical protein